MRKFTNRPPLFFGLKTLG
uniref:Uncharacterized protein n=1 Tax=Anguilla anguilla TaxID=7936 RepID=A0A0E9SS04_ANGAN